MTDKNTERPAKQVRQGERGRPVLAVLLSSLALLVLVFVGLSLLMTADIIPSIGGINGTG